MGEMQTQAGSADPHAFLAAIADPGQRADAHALAALLARATGEVPVMWGPAIVGFGRCTYALANGRHGEMLRIGFSPRKGQTVLYGLGGAERFPALVTAIGKHTTGKGCVYIKRLADIETGALEVLCSAAYAATAGRALPG